MFSCQSCPVTVLHLRSLPLQELWDVVSDLQAEGTDEMLLEALCRGIGVHHSGLDTRYRQAVEMLFRSRHLQVGVSCVCRGGAVGGVGVSCQDGL